MMYSAFFKRDIDVDAIDTQLPKFDLFISAFNSSDRVTSVFDQVRANKKVWLVHPEYRYNSYELPVWPHVVAPTEIDEVAQVRHLLATLGDLSGKSICVDITGFMRGVLAFLVAKFAYDKIAGFTALYAEPTGYKDGEKTIFSTSTTGDVGPVGGMQGDNDDKAKDVLLVGMGFDHRLVNEVLNFKDDVTVYPILGFPSLSPEMFQQSAIRSSQVSASTLEPAWLTNRNFAPANDPFATATVVSDLVRKLDLKKPVPNVYLSPLSTKAQALGFVLYWLLEGKDRGAVTLLLPRCSAYARETSFGFSRLWAFEIETQP